MQISNSIIALFGVGICLANAAPDDSPDGTDDTVSAEALVGQPGEPAPLEPRPRSIPEPFALGLGLLGLMLLLIRKRQP